MSGRVDVLSGWSCNSRCRFCSQGTLRDERADLPDAVVRQRIAAARALGDVLVLTGGEPTLRDELAGWVALARELGFRRVEVQTNGRMLSYKGFVTRMVEAGVGAFQIALHGHEAAVHDWHTQAEGSFEQAVRGIQRARAHDVQVLVTTVVTRSNFRHLPEIAALALSLGASGWRVSAARPVGLAAAALVATVPRYEQLAAPLQRALGLWRRVRRPATVKGVPACVLGGDERGVVELRSALAEAHLEAAAGEPVRQAAAEDRMVHAEACARCDLRERCPGVPLLYDRRYGAAELQPIRAARTAA